MDEMEALGYRHPFVEWPATVEDATMWLEETGMVLPESGLPAQYTSSDS